MNSKITKNGCCPNADVQNDESSDGEFVATVHLINDVDFNVDMGIYELNLKRFLAVLIFMVPSSQIIYVPLFSFS